MTTLDNFELIKKLDQSNLLGSVQQLYLQLRQAKEDLKKLELPQSYFKVNKVVVNGMGGSRLGARVIERLFFDSLKVPFLPIGSYTLPGFVDEKTLLILSSYSGDTEEILLTIEEAEKRKANILIFAQGGKLSEIAREKKLPGYFNFCSSHNPCNLPRMGIGYQILGMILLLWKCDLVNLTEQQILEIINFVKGIKEKCDLPVPQEKNQAKILSQRLHQKIPVLIGSEFLVGALHTFRNQIHENAKQMAIYFEIPELCHHLMDGLNFPKSNQKNLIFLFIESDLYHQRNQKRFEVTKKLVSQAGMSFESLKLTGLDKILQAFEVIQLGAFVSFYLAMLNQIDPSPIPMIDYFKQELEKFT